MGHVCAKNCTAPALLRVAQTSSRCPVLVDIQGQAEQGSKQPDVAVCASVHCRGVGGDLPLKVPFQLKWFCDYTTWKNTGQLLKAMQGQALSQHNMWSRLNTNINIEMPKVNKSNHITAPLKVMTQRSMQHPTCSRGSCAHGCGRNWAPQEGTTALWAGHTAAARGLQWHRWHTPAQGGTQQHSAEAAPSPAWGSPGTTWAQGTETSAQGRSLGHTWAASLRTRHCTALSSRWCQREQTAGLGAAAHSAAQWWCSGGGCCPPPPFRKDKGPKGRRRGENEHRLKRYEAIGTRYHSHLPASRCLHSMKSR